MALVIVWSEDFKLWVTSEGNTQFLWYLLVLRGTQDLKSEKSPATANFTVCWEAGRLKNLCALLWCNMKTTNHLSIQHCQQNWVTSVHEWLRINCLAKARIMHRQATLHLFVLQQHLYFIALLEWILSLHQVSSTSSPPFWTGVTYRWGGVEGLGNTCYLHAGMSKMLNMVLKILPAFQKKLKVAPYCWWYLSYYSKKYIRCTVMFFSL